MSFKSEFGTFVCEGDSISCDVDGLHCVATLYRDDCCDAPDERDDGFWPSLDPNDAGWIGPKSKRTLARHAAKVQAVMDAWKRDEWHYFGVAVVIYKSEVQLTSKYGNALWGIAGNYPGADNSYLRCVANELLPEALDAARATLAKLAA